MKKEIKEIKKIIKDFEEEIKTVNLYKKYLDKMENGFEIFEEDIEDKKVYLLAKQAYEQDKADEIRKLAEVRREKYVQLLEKYFFMIKDGLGMDFVDRCIKNIEDGEIEQVKVDLEKREEKIEVRPLNFEGNSSQNSKQTSALVVPEKTNFLVKIFGKKKEVYNPNMEVCKPNIKDDIEKVIKTLENLEEVTKITALYNKYLAYIKNGTENKDQFIEDIEIYELAKELYKGGNTTIAEFQKYSNDRKKSYIDSLQEQLEDLKSRLGSTYMDRCMCDIKMGEVTEIKELFEEMKDRVKTKRIRGYKNCVTDDERKLFDKAKKKSPIRTMIFGIEVEVIGNKNIEVMQPSRNKLNVKKVNLDPFFSPEENNYKSISDKDICRE